MLDGFRQTGISVIGPVPWGTHFCQFYQTKDDLLDILIPYFKAGLENNEYCMWVTAEPLSAQAVHEAMSRAMPDFDERLGRGQIEILPHTDWYLKGGSFDQKRVLNGWVERLDKALTAGYEGLRLTGNTFWLEKRDWDGFTEYEAAINDVIGKYPMLALCTYSLDKCGSAEVMDVIRNHEFALIRRDGNWELIENAIHKQSKQALLESERKYRQLLETLQEGIWVIDKNFLTTFINPHMAKMLGYAPDEMLGKSLFSFISKSNRDIAKERMERRRRGIKEQVDFTFLKKDGSNLDTLVSAAPVIDSNGNFSGVIAGIVDITERKHAEEAVRESRAKLQAAFASMTEAIFIADAEGRLIEFNDEFVRYHRFKDRDECSRTIADCPKYLDVWFSDGTPAPIEQWAMPRALRGETASNVEYRLRRKETGETWWGSYSFAPIKDQNGKIIGGIVASREITELKRAEQALQESEVRYRKIVETAQEGIVVGMLDGRFEFVNQRMADMLGYTREEMIGKTGLDFMDTDQKKIVISSRKMLEEGQIIHTEYKFRCKDGSTLWTFCSASGIYDESGRHIGNLAMHTDITDRKRAENELRQAALRYRTVADNTYDFEFWINPEGRFIYISPSCQRITGRMPSEFLNDPSLRRRLVHPDDISIFDNHIAEEDMHIQGDAEFRILHADGKYRWIAHVCQPVFDEHGQYLGIRGSNRDITQRKQADKDLRETRDYLENLLDYANAPIIVWNPELHITRFNKAFQRLTDRKEDTVLGQHLSILFPEETRKKSLSYIQRAMRGERWETVEIPILSANGEVHTVLWNSANIHDPGGKTIVATIAQGQDITERKQAEEELRETRDYLNNLLEYANAPIIVWDPQFRITKFNRAFERLTMLNANEVLGKKLDILFPEQTRAESLDHIRRTASGERWEVIEIPILRTDGSVRIVLWNSATLYASDGKTVLATIAQGQDITERKQAEALEHIGNIGSWEWNLTTGELEWSDEVYSIFGLEPGQLEGTRESFLNYVHPDDSKKIESSMNEALHNHEKEAYDTEFRIVRPNGSIRVVNEKARVYLNRKGKPVRAVGTIQDITERKAVEERLKNLSRRLVDIQEKERRGIARELHDGLAQSLATVKILLDRGAKPSIDIVPIIDEASDVVQDVIDQVREMSLNLRPSMLDDLGLLPALQWHFEQVTSRTGVKVNFKHSGLKLAESNGLPTEVRTAVYRIVQEAISNAIRHAQADQVDISIRIRANTLHLLVEDHGKGFDIDAMPDVSSGLSTMQERAYLCGGNLVINSAPGAGTRISAEIPL